MESWLYFVQGILFYTPHLLFKMWEGGKVKGILGGLNTIIMERNDRFSRQRTLANYFVESLNTHNIWAGRLLLVEVLNLINVIGNIFFVDVFLGGEFTTYGTDVLRLVHQIST